jgi:hypothetical protein
MIDVQMHAAFMLVLKCTDSQSCRHSHAVFRSTCSDAVSSTPFGLYDNDKNDASYLRYSISQQELCSLLL